MRKVKNFSDVDMSKTVFVQFGASWCGPCKTMTSFIESKIEPEYPEVTFLKIDVDDCDNNMMKKHNISSVPKVFVYKNGSIESSFVGFKKEKIIGALQS
tara:strand:- start:2121 stop:2417 length:297 start_codon:yes stop_codon:yes gene_type:complete